MGVIRMEKGNQNTLLCTHYCCSLDYLLLLLGHTIIAIIHFCILSRIFTGTYYWDIQFIFIFLLRIKIRCMYKHIFHHMYQEKEKLEAPGLVWVDTTTNLACEMPWSSLTIWSSSNYVCRCVITKQHGTFKQIIFTPQSQSLCSFPKSKMHGQFLNLSCRVILLR